MKQPEIHFCLLSDQQVANIIPLLYEPLRPGRVVLLVSQAMKTKAPQACRMMQSLGLKVDVREIDSYDIHAIQEQVMRALAEFEGHFIGLNLTGGTKIMALGAYEAFSTDQTNPIFYLDTRNQRILFLSPEYAEYPLPELLDVRTSLGSYGFTVQKAPSGRFNFRKEKLTSGLANRASYYGKAMSRFNFLAAQAENSLTVQLDSRSLRDQRLVELAELFREYGVLDHDGRGTLIFPDEPSLRYARGGWLEEHVAKIVHDLKANSLVFDWTANIMVKSPAGADNELDLAFTAKNRLHLIECKTVNYQSPQGYARADQAAYKLHSLRQETAGVFGKAMIVSFRELRGADRQRSKDLNIDVVQAGELANLRAKLQDWISQ